MLAYTKVLIREMLFNIRARSTSGLGDSQRYRYVLGDSDDDRPVYFSATHDNDAHAAHLYESISARNTTLNVICWSDDRRTIQPKENELSKT